MKNNILIIALALSPWGFSFAMDVKYRSELVPHRAQVAPHTKVEQKQRTETAPAIASKAIAKKPPFKCPLPLCTMIDRKKPRITQPQNIKKWNITAPQKVAIFSTMLANPQRDLKGLYTLAHDPVIKQHIKDNHIFQELLAFTKSPAIDQPANADEKKQQDELDQCITMLQPTQAKTILEHAIDANDAPFIGFIQSHLNVEQRFEGVRYAAQNQKPQSVLALIPKDPEIDDEQALKKFFMEIKDLTIPEIDGFNATLTLCAEYKKLRSSFTKKMFSAISAKTSFSQDAHQSVHEMLYPFHSQNPKQMHPDLQHAIASNNFSSLNQKACFDFAARTAYDPDESESTPHHLNKDGLDALELATHSLNKEAFETIISQNRYIPPKKQQRLKDIATQALHEKYPPRNPNALLTEPKKSAEQEEWEKKYNEIMHVLNTEFPALQEQNNRKLIDALTQYDTGKILHALQLGANPNCTFDNGMPLITLNLGSFRKILLTHGANPNCSFRLSTEPYPMPLLYRALCSEGIDRLRMLLEHGADPNTLVIDSQNQKFSMLKCAMELKKLEHFKMLLEYGANPHTLTHSNLPLTCEALGADPKFLEILLASGADPHVGRKASDHNRVYSLLEWSWIRQKPEHTKIILKYIKPNALSAGGNLLTLQALDYDDPSYLEALLEAGFDPYATIKKESFDNLGQFYSLIEQCWLHRKPVHAKIVLKYIKPNTLSSQGIPLTFQALDYDDPSYLEALLEAGFNPHVTIKFSNEGRQYSLLEFAWERTKPLHAKIILKYIERNALSSQGIPLTFEALFYNYFPLLEALLQAGFDPYATIKLSGQDRDYSLLEFAWIRKKILHANMIIKYIKPDTLSPAGTPLTYEALFYDDFSYLEALLQAGFDPNARIKAPDDNIFSLHDWCMIYQKPDHARIVEKYQKK